MNLRRAFCVALALSLPVTPLSAREDAPAERMRIYQLLVRLFGNTNETRQENGTLAQNGVGKFNQINDAALASLRAMGFTHLWLTGVLQQATGTDYSSIGQPADDPDLLKGVAGSPYAIKDYFDVCPDYAEKPAERLDEFKALLDRIHRHELKALIDFVPNHVARSYGSDVKPDLDFGKDDDKAKFFAADNNFFYLQPGHGGPPLRLPTQAGSKNLDGLFEPEREHGRVTGNNAVTWTPSRGDWYETLKLNYGFDFTAPGKNVREYPTALTPDKPIPNTWKKMDQVLAYWQSLGVDGFRCDMSHMVPPEFWTWALARARTRQANTVFIAEAYDNDPAKVPAASSAEPNVMGDLLKAGFTAVYDDPSYKAVKKIYDGPGWANDIDDARPNEFIAERSLRYAENHDEVRLAAAREWGRIGMQVGPAVCAILYGLSRGPILLYNGQEVGETAAGVEGFGGDDSRTTIFDYWSMPALVPWVNDHRYDGGKLAAPQKDLRARYARLLSVVGEPAFRAGNFIPLNALNRANPHYGRLGHEEPSGHWLYSFCRYDAGTGQRFLVTVNLHPHETLRDVKVRLDQKVLASLGYATSDPKTPLVFEDRLAASDPVTATSCLTEATDTGIWIGDIPPLTAYYFEVK